MPRTAGKKKNGAQGHARAKTTAKVLLDPNAPGLDKETRLRRRSLAKMQQLSTDEVFQLAVRAGIYTKSGKLTKHYREDAEPSASRPSD